MANDKAVEQSLKQEEWLKDIEGIFEESGLLTAELDLEEDKAGNNKVYYVVGLMKNDEQERIATIYQSPSESYDAEAVADIIASAFELVPSLVERLREWGLTDTDRGNKLGAVRFMVDRAIEAVNEDDVSLDTLKSLIRSMYAILYSEETGSPQTVTNDEKQNDRVSLIHLLPDSARAIFGDS